MPFSKSMLPQSLSIAPMSCSGHKSHFLIIWVHAGHARAKFLIRYQRQTWNNGGMWVFALRLVSVTPTSKKHRHDISFQKTTC